MATEDEVRKLAELARIELPEEKLAKLVTEFDQVLAYVGQLDTLTVNETEELLPYRNILRKDGEPHEKGIWTEALAAQFPERDGTYLAVKKIISHD